MDKFTIDPTQKDGWTPEEACVPTPKKVLHLEDDRSKFLEIQEHVLDAEVTHITNFKEFQAHLKDGDTVYDLIILDNLLPMFAGSNYGSHKPLAYPSYFEARKAGQDCPIIQVSSRPDYSGAKSEENYHIYKSDDLDWRHELARILRPELSVEEYLDLCYQESKRSRNGMDRPA